MSKSFFFNFLILLFFVSCSSNDDTTPSIENNYEEAPTGKLIRIVRVNSTSIPNSPQNSTTIFNYEDGRVISSTTAFTGGTSETLNYFYNSNDQIWKVTSSSSIEEFTFSNGIVVSSELVNNGTTTTSNYIYDSNGNLSNRKYYDSENNLTVDVDYTYDINNNMTYSISQFPSGNSVTYNYEYDQKIDPIFDTFENQKAILIKQLSNSNATNCIYNHSNGTTNTATIEHTYNENNLPISSIRYINGNYSSGHTYTYQD